MSDGMKLFLLIDFIVVLMVISILCRWKWWHELGNSLRVYLGKEEKRLPARLMFFEWDPNGPWSPRSNHCGAMRRWILGPLSFGWVQGGVNDMVQACVIEASIQRAEQELSKKVR
jgi:hypothetical protein